MKIAIVGALESRSEALESSYARAFKALGHQLLRWDPALALAQVARGGSFGSVFSRFVHVEPWVRKANADLLAQVTDFEPDVILIIGTSGVRAGTLAQIKVRLPNTHLACLYPDSPHNLDVERITALPIFEHVFVSSPAWVNPFRHLGSCNVTYLPFAADTLIHKPVPRSDTMPIYDVGFVGTWRPDREKLLERLVDYKLAIWGSRYWRDRTKRDSKLRSLWMKTSLAADQLPSACTQTRVMLNIIDGHTWPGPNMRCFELPACGAFALVSRTPAVTELFEEGKTIECFDTIDEARSKIEYYLANEEKRREIAEAAYKFVTEHGHTYIDRANSIIKLLKQDQADA